MPCSPKFYSSHVLHDEKKNQILFYSILLTRFLRMTSYYLFMCQKTHYDLRFAEEILAATQK